MFVGLHYVNGVFWSGSPEFITTNPATGEVLGTFPSGLSILDEAVLAARKAFHSWKKLSRVKRADYFYKLCQLVEREKEMLAYTITLETGKTLNESNAEVIEALHMCQVAAGSGRTSCGEVFASELSDKEATVIRKPKGVVGIISPWNFPLAIGSFWCAAPAIVEGNCVVHKPSELTPMIAQLVAKLYKEAGFPPGVYNLVHGAGDVGGALVRSDVDAILFTGSAEVGLDIRQHCAQGWKKSCACETGSKSAVIICKDADLDLAVNAAIASAFKLSGQRCVSASRLIVQREIFDQFATAFVEKASGLRIGDPLAEEVDMGPLISAEAVNKVEAWNEKVRQDFGCLVLLDGKPLERVGHFISPFVYRTEWCFKRSPKPFLKEEVFGPHVALIPFDNIEDAIEIYNDTDYSLALGVITEDFRTMRLLKDECRAGMIYLNGGSIAAESHLPFGGLWKSGSGHKSAAGTFRAVTDEVAVTMNYERGISWAQGMK